MNTTKAPLYLRRRDAGPSEALNAAAFHQIGRTITSAIIDLESLPIANVDKSERMDRQTIAQIVQAATRSLSDLCNILERVQDEPLPMTCPKCIGRGWIEKPRDISGRQPCPRCEGAGVVEDGITIS